MNELTKPVEAVVITQYEKIKTDIAILAQEDKDAVFQYREPKGNALARSHVFKMRKVRGEIERARKEAKAYALAYGKRVDGAAAELESQVDALIKRHQDQIDAIENEERDRKAKHQAVIAGMQTAAMLGDADSATVAKAIDAVRAVDCQSLDEFKPDGLRAQAEAVAALTILLERAKVREAEAAELVRLRAEAAARVEAERIAAAQREAVESERKRAEREQAEKDARAKVEAEAKDRAAREAVEAAERAKAEAERRVKAQEEAARALAAKVEADQKASVEREARMAAQIKAEAERRVKEEAERKAEDARRAEVRAAYRGTKIKAIAASLSELKAAGKIASMTALATCIVDGDVRGVSAD
jgi:hypothetical protein